MPIQEIMSNILNTEEEVRNFLLSSPVEDVDPSAHLFVAVIKARLIRASWESQVGTVEVPPWNSSVYDDSRHESYS